MSASSTCETCRFLRSFDDREAVCRRFPPVTLYIGNMAQYPFVHRTDWCGEYQPHPQAEPVEP